jgi:hypothetical protein
MIRCLKLFVIFCTVFFFLFNCERAEKLAPTQQEKLIQIGESSAMALMKDLKKHLLETLAEDDLVSGFEYCAAQAIALTENVQDSLPPGITVKRTSTKHRNPQNAPDELEKEVLDYFTNEYSKTGNLPRYYIQQSTSDEWRYYKPMAIGKLCLKCHGTMDLMEENVVLSLKENYPDDKATGYKLNEFRGVVRVSIPVKLLSE